jgi:energy-coupling factor transporter ATP-binding protein EcfA2
MGMQVVIENCNNIDVARFSLEPGRLNIKYGPNGTGKSTLAKAIELSCSEKPDLTSLRPFKHRGNSKADTEFPCNVTGLESIKTIAVFNDKYLEQFVFRQDEILKNSFEIFVRNADYDAKMAQIESLVADIRNTFKESDEIDSVLKDLTDLSESFGKSQSGFSKAGRIAKGLGGGNKIDNVPEKLAPYSAFIRSSSTVNWIKWQIQGNDFLKLSSDCPYCTSPTADKQETILAVSTEYDAKSIEHLVGLKATLDRLNSYFSADSLAVVQSIVATRTGLKEEEINYLLDIKKQVDILRRKIDDAKTASFFSLKDVDKVQQRFEDMKIRLETLNHLQAAPTEAIVEKVNASLDAVLEKAGELQGEVNKHKKGIESTIERYRGEINEFLIFAGYRYAVEIQLDGTSYKMKLRHQDFGGVVENGQSHLSYGEKNAFSIVLFMYECLRKDPDLIVLDDPISSFDKNKKFAIMEKLFRGKRSLQGRTTLMLTHDIEPLIDLVKVSSLARKFNPPPVAHFLACRGGVVSETLVKREDIQTFAQICTENIKLPNHDLVKVVYLRRHFELLNERGVSYELLSSLLHKRETPTVQTAAGTRDMTTDEIESATVDIRRMMPSFNYSLLLEALNDAARMRALYASCTNGYEKLQLFRAIEGGAETSDVVRKFIDETYHIENEYVMQLNPLQFDPVPEYVTLQCDRFVM